VIGTDSDFAAALLELGEVAIVPGDGVRPVAGLPAQLRRRR
jgi:hypothetical protein